ncbi:hypothetical protein T10_12143 [Trichinella papuae]|uniref:Uncharacterized protein n=1 Tax=Trichinella papuae TaxID=268474 RepID=A0A0V1MD11_9BILA|nr:hypothetical protein T10_12143 [Trichinella papuae]
MYIHAPDWDDCQQPNVGTRSKHHVRVSKAEDIHCVLAVCGTGIALF